MHRKIEEILTAAHLKDASDIHVASGEMVAVRLIGEISFLEELGVMTKIDVLSMVTSMLDQEALTILEDQKEHDFCHASANGNRYRCNVFYQKGLLSLSMRHIKNELLNLDEIGTPEKIKSLLTKKQGLILLSGPAGSGKSTTMAAMIDWINSNRTDRIIMIEDPIEYFIENKKCFISQREIHSDTKSFSNSIRAAMRQDPNIIVIGEIRDRETMEAVMRLCNSGHLVISTIHTSSSSQALYRILSMFPVGQHKAILSQLGDTLLGILNQRLVRSLNEKRIAIFEFMLANLAIKNAVRNGDIAQIENSIATGAIDGMQTFKHHIQHLALTGKINYAETISIVE